MVHHQTRRITVTTAVDRRNVELLLRSKEFLQTLSIIYQLKFRVLIQLIMIISSANIQKKSVNPGNASSAEVVIETDTVSGASPYIFNVSMRSVFGMQGIHRRK